MIAAHGTGGAIGVRDSAIIEVLHGAPPPTLWDVLPRIYSWTVSHTGLNRHEDSRTYTLAVRFPL